MKNEIKEILEYLRNFGTLREDAMISEIEDYITNLQDENNHLKQNKERTLEYIENNRIREKCIVDVNALEGLLNE